MHIFEKLDEWEREPLEGGKRVCTWHHGPRQTRVSSLRATHRGICQWTAAHWGWDPPEEPPLFLIHLRAPQEPAVAP